MTQKDFSIAPNSASFVLQAFPYRQYHISCSSPIPKQFSYIIATTGSDSSKAKRGAMRSQATSRLLPDGKWSNHKVQPQRHRTMAVVPKERRKTYEDGD